MARNDTLIPPIRPTHNPLIVRGTTLSKIADQINKNTLALRPPRQVFEVTDDDDVGAQIWEETFKTTTTQRVENPEDSEQYVDVDHRTESTFQLPDGTQIILRFLAPDA